jgi:hypothetical protein
MIDSQCATHISGSDCPQQAVHECRRLIGGQLVRTASVTATAFELAVVDSKTAIRSTLRSTRGIAAKSSRVPDSQ